MAKKKNEEAKFDPNQGNLFRMYRPDSSSLDEREKAKLSWVYGDKEEEMFSLPVAEKMSLEEAQKVLLNKVDEGTDCPCCGRWAKTYQRNINNNMARSLIWIVSQFEQGKDLTECGFVDVPNNAPRWIVRSNQFPTLRWWGLVARKEKTDEGGGKHLGFWKPTGRGISFAKGEIKVERSVFTLFGRVIGFGEEEVYIQDCFKNNFEYEEVMEPVRGF